MPLDMPDGTACFIDANIFYYHFVETPPLSQASTSFLERVAAGTIAGYSSVHVLAEAVHKIMLAEAAAVFGLNRAGLVNWLQHHRDRITQLQQFQQAPDELLDMNLSIPIADPTILQEAARLSKERGLLTNDATALALIRRQGLSHLATNDDDFDGTPGLTVWKPR
jgi:predicted nucleic acid-binding protein